MPLYESDSDAPDDVSFSTTKKHALQEFEITKHERERQDNSKEWRKKRDALYKEQKEKKVLSMSVLTAADNELNEKLMSGRKRKQFEEQDDSDGSDRGFSDVDSSDEESPDAVKEHPLSDENECRLENNEDLPRLTIKSLDTSESKSMLQAALDFKKNALYNKKIKRLTMAEYKQQRKKIQITQKNRRILRQSRREKRRRVQEMKRSKVQKCA